MSVYQATVTQVELAVISGEVVDQDAADIGAPYERSNSSLADAVIARLECGHRLAEKKASMAHGEWLPWLEANSGLLGFDTRRTAARLIKASQANGTPASHLDEAAAAKLSRQMWGHKGDRHVHVGANSGNNEWYTPADIIEAARRVLGRFDLDPASSEVANKTVKAERFFTAENDGLAQDWGVGRIWMNPPYSQPLINQFCQKFAAAMNGGATGIALVNNATETAWFQMLARSASAICFPQSRIRFNDPSGAPSGSPLQGQAVIYSGLESGKFLGEFSKLGFVMEAPWLRGLVDIAHTIDCATMARPQEPAQ